MFSGSETPEPDQKEHEEDDEEIFVVASILWKDPKRPRSPDEGGGGGGVVSEEPAPKVQVIEDEDEAGVRPRSPPPAPREPCGSVTLPLPSGVPVIEVLDDENPMDSGAASNVRKSGAGGDDAFSAHGPFPVTEDEDEWYAMSEDPSDSPHEVVRGSGSQVGEQSASSSASASDEDESSSSQAGP